MKKTIISVVLIMCLCLTAALGVACGKEPEEEKQPEREAKTLMVGDSLFDLWKIDCEDALDGAENLRNVAIGGTNSVYWQKSEKVIRREMPTVIILCLGTNDIADLRRTGKGAAEGDEEHEECLQGVLEMFHSIVPDAYVYYLTINICGENTRWNMREEINSCNNIMRAYCADKDWVEIVETEYAFYDDDDYTQKPNPDYFVADYLHFSPKGYQVLTKILRKSLGLSALAEA